MEKGATNPLEPGKLALVRKVIPNSFSSMQL